MKDRRCTFSATSILLALGLAAPAPARAGEAPSRACSEPPRAGPVIAGALGPWTLGGQRAVSLRVSPEGEAPALRAWLASDEALRELHDGASIDAATAAALLARLEGSGLFAAIAVERGPEALALRLALQPRVLTAEVRGARESSRDGLLAQFLGPASRGAAGEPREEVNRLGFSVWRKQMDLPPPDCADAPSAERWFARIERGALAPGLLRGGLEAGRARVLAWLAARGYPRASLQATLSAEGALLLSVDEGAIESFEARGLRPALQREVARALALEPGGLLSNRALHAAVERLTAELPFVLLDPARGAAARTPAGRAADEPGLFDGTLDLGELGFSWEYAQGAGARASVPETSIAGTALEQTAPGRTLLWLRARPLTLDVDWIQLLRHTPATGFAPGLAATLHHWDEDDRAHLALDGALALNSKRAARAAGAGADWLERLSAQEQVDWLAGARVAIPAWRVAELGAQLYALTDTNDTWRMSDTNSYVHSALLALPDREYFRRAGATLLATAQLERLTLGAELRRDRFDALPNPRVWSLVNNDVPPLPAAPVTPGELSSLLFRVEWSSDETPLRRTGALHRHAETSLSAHAGEPGPTLLALATVELGHLDGQDATVVHALGDARLQLAPLEELLVRVRLRAGAGANLPLQEQEALGGWSALRGYAFKEFRGDASLLGNLEARWRFLGGFFDLGTVHSAAGWTGVRPGVGAQLILQHIGSLEAAWRLDRNGTAVPSYRALLGWDL